MKKDGVGIIEVPHLFNIIKENQYDNIFHEHIGFHSLKSLKDLCEMSKLKIFDVQKINSQGGSLRCFIAKKKSAYKEQSKIVNWLLKKEKILKINEVETHKNFFKKCELQKKILTKYLKHK